MRNAPGSNKKQRENHHEKDKSKQVSHFSLPNKKVNEFR